jgi:RNA polymerase sigma-70 factor (ECF subfamily)
MKEQEAITQLKRGNIDGLEALVRQYQVRAVRTAYLITRDRALAEDIVQAAFLRIYERIGQFDGRRRFGPWFLRIVANDAIKATVRRKRLVSLECSTEEEGISLVDLLVDPNPGPAEVAQAEEERQAIWTALGKLPPAQRATVVLRYYVGLSEAEIADELHCPSGTVKWRLHTARKRLLRLLYFLCRRRWNHGAGS